MSGSSGVSPSVEEGSSTVFAMTSISIGSYLVPFRI